MAHSYGFSNLVLPLLLHGIPLILGAGPLPESLAAAAAAAEGAASGVVIPAVPALWRAWIAADAIPAQTRIAISAGAPLPVELEREAHRRFGVKIHNFYGSSECGGIAYDATSTPRDDSRVVGRPMQGVELSLDPGQRLVVRSAAAGLGYCPPEPGETGLGGGLFRTADLAACDGGIWRLMGRESDLINVAGRKLPPELIEDALRAIPGVTECLVLGVASEDPARGEEILAIVADDGRTPHVESLRRSVIERLPGWQVPRRWWQTSELTANARGKLSRAHWRERWIRSHQPARGVP